MRLISDRGVFSPVSWLWARSKGRAARSLRLQAEVRASERTGLARHGTVVHGCEHLKKDCDARKPRQTILGRFGRSQRGLAALEFALVAPFLIALFLGGFELTRYITAVRKLTNMTNTIAEMVAQNTTGSVNSEDLQFYMNSVLIDFPQILGEARLQGTTWDWIIQITISSIYFTPTTLGCTSNCTYNAYPAFSAGGNQRPCFTKLTPVANSAPSTPATLPADAYGPGSIIVVDVTYSYRPRVATRIFGAMPIRRSFYIQPRYVSLVKYDYSNGQWVGQACV